MIILGIDPGLRNTGFGIIEKLGNKLNYIADGTLHSDSSATLAVRLKELHLGICEIIKTYKPEICGIEETFVTQNVTSTLRLGQARGAIILAPALYDLPIYEFAPNKIKKAVVGVGHAGKEQVQHMVSILLGRVKPKSADSADALAIAITLAHNL